MFKGRAISGGRCHAQRRRSGGAGPPGGAAHHRGAAGAGPRRTRPAPGQAAGTGTAAPGVLHRRGAGDPVRLRCRAENDRHLKGGRPVEDWRGRCELGRPGSELSGARKHGTHSGEGPRRYPGAAGGASALSAVRAQRSAPLADHPPAGAVHRAGGQTGVYLPSGPYPGPGAGARPAQRRQGDGPVLFG